MKACAKCKNMSNNQCWVPLALIAGFVLGAGIFWSLGTVGILEKQSEYRNRTEEEITALKENVKELQIHNANLTATVMNYQVKLKECESSLTRTRDQLNKKIKEANQCQQEKENCEKQLHAANHVSTVHRDHSCWIVLFTFCLMLLYNQRCCLTC